MLHSSRARQFLNKLSSPSVLLTFLIALGIFFRVRQYVFDRSLWLDEALLSQNIVARPLDRLLTEPLDNNQAAPLGLLLLAKWSVTLFGETDLALRLVPLVFGILALFLALDVSHRAFQSDAARVTFVGLVTVSPILIYYSSEIKQYGVDASVSLLLVWASLKFKDPSAKSLAALALIGSLAVWLSHPSAFVLAAIGATFLLPSIITKIRVQARRLLRRDDTSPNEFSNIRKDQLKPTLGYAIVIVLWLANFWIDYAISLGAIASNDYLISYWQSGYAPLTLDGLAWYWESALGLVYLAFRQTDLTVVSALAQWFDGWNIVLLIAVTGGLVASLKHLHQLFSIVALALVVAIIVSAYHLYPFRNRMLLFLVPLVFIVVSSAIEGLARWRMPVAWATAIGLVFSVAAVSIPIAIHPHNAYDIKGALSYIRARRAPADAIALQFWSQPAFDFYATSFGLGGMPLVATMTADANVDALLKSVCASAPPRRTWIVFSHIYEQHVPVVERLRSIAPQLDAWEGDNAGAFLFDFSHLAGNCKQ